MTIKYRLLVFLFTAAVGGILISCGGDSGILVEPTPTPTPTNPTPVEPTADLTKVRGDIATNLANGLIIPAYEVLKDESDNLVEKVETFSTSPTEANLVAAQTALKNSWLAWQKAAIYMFGPAEEVALRKSLNTYPTDATQIDANIESGNYILGSLANQAAVGFPALDYLLNGLAEDNADIMAKYMTAERSSDRKKYLTDLATDIQTRVTTSLNGWLPTGENYIANFTETDALGIDVGSSLSIIVNSIDLHLQRFARDGKVAIPAGIRSAGVPRPKAIEALYGGYSTELLQASLVAYEQLYMGVGANDEDKESLYDYLVAIDAKDLADDIQAQFEVVKTAANTLTDPFGEQIATDVDKVTNVFIEIQKLVVFFKADMASLMGISITNQDNDGD